MLGVLIGTVLWWAAYLVMARRDRRRLRMGIVLLLAVHASISSIVSLVAPELPMSQALAAVVGAMVLLGVLGLAFTVLLGAVVVSRTESEFRGRVLTSLGAVALLALTAAAIALVSTSNPPAIRAGVVLGAVSAHFGLAFLVFLASSVPYQLLPPRRESTGIIVLGSTLLDGSVPPLLRHRLERAVAERARLLALGIDPMLVPSGGKGDEASPAESTAMAAHLLTATSVPADRVRPEGASRTTEENLVLSHRLLDEAGHRGPYIVATSRYHAFRAALLARSLGFADQAIGCSTTWSYLPTATVREFVITMSYRKRWIAALAPATLGLVAWLVTAC